MKPPLFLDQSWKSKSCVRPLSSYRTSRLCNLVSLSLLHSNQMMNLNGNEVNDANDNIPTLTTMNEKNESQRYSMNGMKNNKRNRRMFGYMISPPQAKATKHIDTQTEESSQAQLHEIQTPNQPSPLLIKQSWLTKNSKQEVLATTAKMKDILFVIAPRSVWTD
jgi:hypothetical protein